MLFFSGHIRWKYQKKNVCPKVNSSSTISYLLDYPISGQTPIPSVKETLTQESKEASTQELKEASPQESKETPPQVPAQLQPQPTSKSSHNTKIHHVTHPPSKSYFPQLNPGFERLQEKFIQFYCELHGLTPPEPEQVLDNGPKSTGKKGSRKKGSGIHYCKFYFFFKRPS
jgi:hypothetical protein